MAGTPNSPAGLLEGMKAGQAGDKKEGGDRMTEQSRSVQRRIAAQKGLPAPDFSKQDKVEAINQILQQLLNDWCAGNGTRLILNSYAHAILKLIDKEKDNG